MSMFGDQMNLSWVQWTGSLPNGAVSIYNSYANRTDYVAKNNSSAGFYSPELGPYCNYPWNNREERATDFQVLVNLDNFEVLEWKEGSYGSTPPDAVRIGPGVNIFVGKNKYGLGKVDAKNEAFFQPRNGKEYWYKQYEVLCLNRGAYTQSISHVRYALDKAEVFKQPPEIMTNSTVENRQQRVVTEKVTLSKTTEVQKTWSIGGSTRVGGKTSVTAGIPELVSGTVEVSFEQTLHFNQDTTEKETIQNQLELTVEVMPNQTCNISMEGRKVTLDIPYTARLTRTRGGKTNWTTITGTFKGVQYSEVRSVVEAKVLPSSPVN